MGVHAGGFEGANATSDVLAGSVWRILSVGGEAVPTELDVLLDFGHDGRVSGSTGVNSYTASYSVVGDSVTFGPLATTRRAGQPAAMEVEHRVVGSVAGRCPFLLEGPELTFEGPLGWVRCRSVDAPEEAPDAARAPGGEPPRRPKPGPKPPTA